MMSNHDPKRLAMARALRSALRTEVLEEKPTSEEISQMLVDNGQNPDAIAQQYKDLIMTKIRGANKERLRTLRRENLTNEGFALRSAVPTRTGNLPGIDVIRSRIEGLSVNPEFENSPLLLAYRNGTKQSDSDITSLYEDLLELGVIKDDAQN